MKWEDRTSYYPGKERIPHTWELQLPILRITVTHHIDYPPDMWLMNCHGLGINYKKLFSKDVEDAKKEAIVLVRNRLKNMMDELDEVKP